MARLVILIAILALGLLAWYKISRSSGAQRKKLLTMTLIWAIIATLILLAVTGHLNWITAVIGAIAAMIPRMLGMLKYWPLLNRFYQQRKSGPASEQHRQQSGPRNNNAMSRQEALDILGLKDDASREDIVLAHKRMMQKVHPDRGGSDHLAAQINKAKETLLG